MRPVRFRRSCLSIVLSLGFAACGGAPEKPPALADGAEKKEAAPAGGKAMAVASPEVQELEPLPTKIDSLLGVVPRDAVAVLNLPRPDKLLSAVDAATRKELFEAALNKLANEIPFDQAVTRELIESFDGAVFFLNDASTGDGRHTDEPACLAARFSNGAPVEKLLTSPLFEKQDGARFALAGGGKGAAGVWISGARVLLGCTTQGALSASLRSARKTTPSFESSPLSVPERANDIFVTADMARIDMKAKQEPGSRIFASLASGPKGLGLDVRVTMLGPSYPAIGSVVDASRHETLAKLPANAVGALSLSTTRAAGKTIAHFLHMLEKPLGDDLVEEASRDLEQIGLSLSDFEAALGSDIAVGVYGDPKHKVSLDAKSSGDPTDHGAVLIAIGTRDEGAQKKIVSTFAGIAKKKNDLRGKNKRKIVVTNDSISEDTEKDQIVRMESRKGAVVFAFGNKKFATELLGKFGKEKDALGANKPFVEARAQEKPKSHALAFLDSGVLVGLLSDQKTFKASGAPSFLSLALGPTDQGLELALSGNGATELIGLGASLGVFGMRRYLTSAKTSEAKINVGVIARAAASKYESETVSGAITAGKRVAPQHVLCKSAMAVPAAVPKGVKYQPTDTDYSSGDEASGWRCLLIAFDTSQAYQYEYRVGGNYKGPKRGGPDPGKDGFEASAEGDLDGNGKTSLFTRTGKIVKGEMKLDPEIFISDEFE